MLTVGGDTTVERAMQFIKGGFSYRLKQETGYCGEVWQRGFSEVRVDNERSIRQHCEYIANNPVEAGLVDTPEQFPYSFGYLARKKRQGLKPKALSDESGPAKAVP